MASPLGMRRQMLERLARTNGHGMPVDVGRPRSATRPAHSRSSVLIVDAAEIVRLGLRTALETDSTLMVIGDADTIAKAVQVGERLQPTVAIVASALSDGTALDLCARFQIVAPETRTVILARALDTITVVDAVRAGVAGYLTNHVARDELCRAVRVIASGDVMMDAVSTRALLDGVRRSTARDMPDGTMPLAAQERRVLALVAHGKTNKEIAVELGLSDKTVKNYLSHAFEKLNVSRRAQAAVVFTQISHTLRD